MFNRANKMTALLVAAAAVVSLVPATGVNAADVKRIESKDGIIYNAQAYKDGAYVVDGNIVKDNTEAIYFHKDGKYSELEDLDSGDSFDGVASSKYLNIDGGDYFVDLTNGKVTDDNVKEDDADDAASALRKAVKKDNDGRYREDSNAKGSESLPNLDDAQIKGSKFGDTWYETSYADKKDVKVDYHVYTDAKGKYIDADYNIGKIKVETTSRASITLKNTDTDKLKVDDDVKATIVDAKAIGQDSNNIYRLATIKVEYNVAKSDKSNKEDRIKEINGIDAKLFDTKFEDNKSIVEFKTIQKISKAQDSDDIDGAKYAKTVNTYLFVNKDADENANLDSELKDASDLNYTVANGKVIAYSKDKHKVQTIELSSKSTNYYTDIKDMCKDDITAIDVDVDGDLWMLDSGAVYKWDNDEDWNKVYKVDGAMEFLSVYNKDNMIVWSDDDDEVYSVIGAKEKEEEKPEVEVKAGWDQAADGTWTFVKDGVKATGWFQDGANWYLADAAGIMQTGWKTVNGTWYYLESNGAMQTGWKNVDGAWYYLNPNSDGTRGAMQTGWINDNGTWYFCDGSGKMYANTTVNGYVLGANGAWIK
ncbi:N-acetylmuramoyl-L-alanine amidase family protein [Clostridium botulinum]|nr:N-acetylmuramoyl-L-alanine amidase family protein [Clostridium botulinum]